MSTLLVHPLITELSQEINYNLNDRVQIAAIIPYLIMVNKPTGIFILTLSKGPNTIFEKEFDCNDIQEALATININAHIFLPFVPENLLQIENGLYILKISSYGYVFKSNSYLGWIQQFEDVQNEMDYVPIYDTENSLAYRIKKYKEGIK